MRLWRAEEPDLAWRALQDLLSEDARAIEDLPRSWEALARGLRLYKDCAPREDLRNAGRSLARRFAQRGAPPPFLEVVAELDHLSGAPGDALRLVAEHLPRFEEGSREAERLHRLQVTVCLWSGSTEAARLHAATLASSSDFDTRVVLAQVAWAARDGAAAELRLLRAIEVAPGELEKGHREGTIEAAFSLSPDLAQLAVEVAIAAEALDLARARNALALTLRPDDAWQQARQVELR